MKGAKSMFGPFSEQPEDSVHNAQWEGWTPPWMGQGGPGPQGGPGGPRGGWGHRGWHGPRGPFGFFGGPGRWGQWGIPEEVLALRVQAAEVARLFAIAARGAFGDKERQA